MSQASAKETEDDAAVPKPRRPYLRAEERRRLIIEAAQQVFARSNLQGARTRDIAKAADINQATLFEHFESKEALFHAAVVEPLMETMRGMHDRAASYEAANSLDAISELAQGFAEHQVETMTEIFPLFTAAMFSDLELGKKLYREQILPLFRERAKANQRLIQPGFDIELVQIAMFGITFAFAMDSAFGGEERDAQTLGQYLTRIALTGVAKERAKS